jgi:hypothetical protein
MADASQYTSRRASAAAAAEAHAVVPINAKSTRKRKDGNDTNGHRSRGIKPPLRRLLVDECHLGALLHPNGEIDADEAYGEQEKALSEFLKLHPMLSLCAALSSSGCPVQLLSASWARR